MNYAQLAAYYAEKQAEYTALMQSTWAHDEEYAYQCFEQAKNYQMLAFINQKKSFSQL